MRPETSFFDQRSCLYRPTSVSLGTRWRSLFFAQKEKAATHQDARQGHATQRSPETTHPFSVLAAKQAQSDLSNCVEYVESESELTSTSGEIPVKHAVVSSTACGCPWQLQSGGALPYSDTASVTNTEGQQGGSPGAGEREVGTARR